MVMEAINTTNKICGNRAKILFAIILTFKLISFYSLYKNIQKIALESPK